MKLLYSVLLLVLTNLFNCSLQAQTLDWDWAQHGGGNTKGNGISTCTDASGNIYVSGYFMKSITFGSVTLNAQDTNYYSLFIVKYDQIHIVQWAYGGQNGQALAINTSNDGSVYVTGCHTGTTFFGTTILTSDSGYSAFILKLDANGNQIWIKNIHTDPAFYQGNQFGRAIITDPNGEVYVAGDFSGAVLQVDGVSIQNPNVGCFGDLWFARFSPSGTLNWIKRMGGYGLDEAGALSMDGNGNIYFVGKTDCSGNAIFDTIVHQPQNGEFFTTKFAPSGAIFWARFAGNSFADVADDIYTDELGYSYVTGTTWSNTPLNMGSGISLPVRGYKDHFLVKYDTHGNTIWAKNMGGSEMDNGTGLCVDHWGNICVAGYSQSPQVTLLDDTLQVNGALMYIMRLNSSGALAALHTVDISQNCGQLHAQDMVSDPFGNIYVTGAFANDTAQFGNLELLKSNGCINEYYLARLGTQNSNLIVENQSQSLLQVYPNPVLDELHLSLHENTTVEILSLTGERVLKWPEMIGEQTIDVSSLKKGLYILRAIAPKGIAITELIKE
jgi:hypothetical protein